MFLRDWLQAHLSSNSIRVVGKFIHNLISSSLISLTYFSKIVRIWNLEICMDMRHDTFISKEWPRTKWKKLWLKTNIMDSTILIYPSMGDRSAKLFVESCLCLLIYLQYNMFLYTFFTIQLLFLRIVRIMFP